MTEQNRSGQTSGSSSSTVDRTYDWNTTDRKQFIDQFGSIVGRARNAGVTEQELLDSIGRNYSGPSSGSTR